MESIRSRIQEMLDDRVLYEALKNFASSYKVSRANAYAGRDFDALRSRLNRNRAMTKDRALELFEQFRENAERRGATVHRAANVAEANEIIARIAEENGVTSAVKSKSMTSEETHLNAALARAGVSVAETDLGEYILQVSNDRPSHMVMPAIHLNRAQVADIFTKEFNRPIEPDIPFMVETVRHHLRGSYFEAEMGITGANVAVASSGTIGIVTNEGNARLSSTLPPVHVVLLGYEKLVPSFADALDVVDLLPRSATGQLISTYVTWITGRVETTAREDGRKNLHYVFLDNGRLDAFDDPIMTEAMRCIRCGSCANICPAYELVGGHVFGRTYIGAIGAIYAALFEGLDKAYDILKLCSSCKACSANCPAGIDLQGLIFQLKMAAGSDIGVGAVKKTAYAGVLANPSVFRMGMGIGSTLQRPLVTKDGEHVSMRMLGKSHDFRFMPTVKKPTFTDRMKKRPAGNADAGKTVFFYPGCAVEYFFPDMGEALVNLLERAGVKVLTPKTSACCGLPAAFAGDGKSAVKTVSGAIDSMKGVESADAVVVLCPSCGAAVQENFPVFMAEDAERKTAAESIAKKTTSLAAWLKENGISFRAPGGKKVTYHTPCHLARGMHESAAPYLAAILGDDFVPMTDSDVCCGFAGSYSFDFPELSRGMLDKKLAHAADTGAEILVTDCPGCVTQIGGGAARAESDLRVMHVAELLANLEMNES